MSRTFDYEGVLAQCKAGDRAALRRLYEHEGRWLLGVAYRLVRDKQLAEDVVQDAFLLIWTRAETFRSELGSARGWIYTVVRHRALRELRNQNRVRGVEVSHSEQADDAPIFEDHAANQAIDGAADAAALSRCLDELDPLPRQCIEAAFVEGFTQTELSSRLGKPLGTIKSWIRRGLLSLRECLE